MKIEILERDVPYGILWEDSSDTIAENYALAIDERGNIILVYQTPQGYWSPSYKMYKNYQHKLTLVEDLNAH